MKTEFIRPDWPAPASVRAFCTTRTGGHSSGAWSSFNLGAACGDRAVDVAENRKLLRRELPAEPLWLKQVHGTRVLRADEYGAGPHPVAGSEPPAADACVAGVDKQVCVVLTADCLPVLLCNQAGTRVAAVHAGWRGLVAGVLENAVQAMETQPGQLMAWMGPAIGPAVYQVGGEVREAFITAEPEDAAAFTVQQHADGDRWLLDLYRAARRRLNAAGVPGVYGGGLCTHTDRQRFYSYRRDAVTGRMASLIWLQHGAAS